MSLGDQTPVPVVLNLSDSSAFIQENDSSMSSPYKSVLASKSAFIKKFRAQSHSTSSAEQGERSFVLSDRPGK
jgi:hypothetical protein